MAFNGPGGGEEECTGVGEMTALSVISEGHSNAALRAKEEVGGERAERWKAHNGLLGRFKVWMFVRWSLHAQDLSELTKN